MKKTVDVETTAQAYLELLRDRGVEYIFGNGGTDFAPLVDALARFAADGKATPRPLTIPHEFVAASMAHGYYLVTGRPQVVMVHVTVGTANLVGAMINAARTRTPIIFTAGRTPLTESGSTASRDVYIHWAQESFDQAGMAREWVKWDYELRNGAQIETVVDRALALASSDPKGPVYLTLPREVLAEPQHELTFSSPSRLRPATAPQPDPAAMRQAAAWLAKAERPLIIAGQIGVETGAVDRLAALARRFAIPVVSHVGTYLNLPSDHPMHQGYVADPLVKDADAILVLDHDAPWYPLRTTPPPGGKVVQIGVDPLFSRYPIRGFPSDLAIASDISAALSLLESELATALTDRDRVKQRFDHWQARHDQQVASWRASAEAAADDRPISPEWVSHCLSKVIDDRTTVINEYTLLPQHLNLTRPGSFFNSLPSGGLGWGLGAALGVKLAAPERTVICGLGDGAYMFGAPTPGHWVSRAYDLPVLFVVVNNSLWGAVKRATQNVFPDGWAVGQDNFPFTRLDPSPEYAMVCQANGGYGERVDDPAELPAAIQRGLHAVKVEGRQALLDVRCKQP